MSFSMQGKIQDNRNLCFNPQQPRQVLQLGKGGNHRLLSPEFSDFGLSWASTAPARSTDARLSGEPAVFRPISVAEIGKGSAFGAGLLQSVSSGGNWKHFGFRPYALPKSTGSTG